MGLFKTLAPNIFVPANAGRAGLQAALNSLIGIGGSIEVGPGSLSLDSTPIAPVDNVAIYGQGVGITNFIQTVLATRAFQALGGVNTYNYLAFEGFTVVGMWFANQSLGGDNDRHFAIGGTKRLRFANIESLYCRQMGITAGPCGEVTVTECRVDYCARDGINLTGSRRCIVTNNHILHGWDDAIAIHQTGVLANPPIEGHVVSGNVIEDCNGIKLLGISKANITDNTILRPKAYGIYTLVGGVEGYSDQIEVNIGDNTITDVINSNKFSGGGTLCTGILIGNAAKSAQAPVVGGATPVINLPENLYYLSNTVSAQNSGAHGINIHDNTINGFTLPAGMYSAWGFGLAFTAVGMVDVDLTTGFKFSMQAIRLQGALLSIHISDNIITGALDNVVLDSTSTILDSLKIQGNTFSRFAGCGVVLETATQKYGRVYIDYNTFDGDPYFESPNRSAGPDGTWNPAALVPAVLDSVKYKGVVMRGNVFRNLLEVEHTAASGSSSYEGNTYYMQPNAAATLASPAVAANKGIYSPNGIGHTSDRLIWEDSNPLSATYGQELGRSAGIASSIPTSGNYIAGQFVRNVGFVESGAGGSKYTILGWQRLTTGNTHVLNTDWRELRGQTGN